VSESSIDHAIASHTHTPSAADVENLGNSRVPALQ
jgi:hypothetical protein